MKTNIDLTAISDGRLYDINDLVKVDTGGCQGCSACCHGVGDLVELTPYDVYEMTRRLNLSFEDLLDEHLALRLENGLLLPHLGMQGPDEKCSFLDADGRCTIHSARPGICRLFPLGRVYEQDSFRYFLQAGACVKPRLEKVKIKKWIGIQHYAANKAFIVAWYQLLKALAFRVKFIREEEALHGFRQEVLQSFYRIGPEVEDFYAEFYRILPEAKERLGVL